MNNKLLVRLRSLRVTTDKHTECNNVILYGSANTPCVALDRCSRRASTSPITHRDVENTDIAWSSRVGNAFLPTTQMCCNRWTTKPAHPTYLVSSASMQSNAAHQSGAILIISLIMLLLLMLIGAAGMQTTMLEEKMAGNMRDANLAFQAAEAALRAGEARLDPIATLPTFTNAGVDASGNNRGFYSNASTIPTASEVLKASFWTTNPVAAGGSLVHIKTPPRYIIEELPSTSPTTSTGCSLEAGTSKDACPPVSWYRITARGTGGSDDTVVMVQSIYSR